MCGPMVVCGMCGNNCCNGGYGEIDGKPCPYCKKAYEEQDAFYKTKEAKVFCKYIVKLKNENLKYRNLLYDIEQFMKKIGKDKEFMKKFEKRKKKDPIFGSVKW